MNNLLIKVLAFFLPKGNKSRQLATLVSGAAIGQVIVIAASPILTRIYSPEIYGALAIYVALLSIVSTISGLRYELAIPFPISTSGAINLLALSILCVSFTSIALSILIFIFYPKIPIFLNAPLVAPYLWLFPIGVFLTGIYQSFNFWAIRQKNFFSIAKTSVQQGVGGTGTQLIFGLINSDSFGLILGQIFGQSAGVITLIKGSYKQDKGYIKRITLHQIKSMAKIYSRFPKYTILQSLANTCSTMLPLILFAKLLSPDMAGLYLLAHRTLTLPLNLVGRSIGQVFHSCASESYKKETLDKLTLENLQNLLRIGLVPLIFIAVLAPNLFAIAFGEEWKQAGIYAQWMVPWLLMQFIVSPLSVVTSITGHQRGELVSQIFFVVIRIGLLFLGASIAEKNSAIEYYSVSGFIVYFGFFVWIMFILKINFFVISVIIWEELKRSFLVILLILAVKIYFLK